MNWDSSEIPDQSDRRVVVTGANSGIGLEATRELARAGASVVMACRSVARGEEAAEDVRRTVPSADLDVRELDLADLDSVRAFADGLEGEIDVLVNNAGVMAVPRSETADGFETQFGVNHLGHFALTGLLLDRITDRVVSVSSRAHEGGEMDFDDLHGERDYGRWEAYSQSKLANLLFAYELDRRLDAAGSDVESLACHPGWAATNLQQGPAGNVVMSLLMKGANAVLAQSAADGALPTLYAATAPDAEGGDYIGPGGLFDMRGAPEKQRSNARSRDRDAARRLWTYSEEATDVTFDLPALEATA